MATPNELKVSTLTRAINEIKNPRKFVFNLLYNNPVLLGTNTAELSYLVRGRQIAPFVRRGAAGVLVKGHSERFETVSVPHIRIKRPMTPTDLLDKRRPGNPIFITPNEQSSMIREYVARELANMDDDISHAEEYLACMALRGAVSYVSADEESFKVTFPRSAANDVTLTGTDLWTNSASDPRKNFLYAAETVNDACSIQVTDVLLGKNAAEAFVNNSKVQTLLDNRRVEAGGMNLTNSLDSDGALLLGTFGTGNIRVWRYSSQLALPDGTSFDCIRPDYAEFVSRSPSKEWVTYYGAIEDMKAIGDGQVLRARRFAKSWEVEDPSARWMLAMSNPLPCPRRPDASVSMKVV